MLAACRDLTRYGLFKLGLPSCVLACSAPGYRRARGLHGDIVHRPRGRSGKGPTPMRGTTPAGHAVVTAVPSAAPPPSPIEVPVWTRVLGWLAVVGLIYLLMCAVGIISRGFRGLGGDAAHGMFAFAGNSWVGLCVGVL